MGEVRMKRLVITMLVLVGVCGPVAAADVSAGPPRWAPVGQATIHPGVQTQSRELQCTANFVFYDRRSVYLGQAAHCTSYDLNQGNNGCDQVGHRLGTTVAVQGASHPATLVYNSFLTMQRRRETRPAVCEGNDFALLRLHPRDVGRVNPSVPFWGGPSTAATGRTSAGERAFTFGNSSLRGGVEALMPKTGVNTSPVHAAIEDTTGWGGGETVWTHYVTTASPGIPGDSGSPFLDADGRALGLLSTISLDGSTGVTDLAQALRYMKATTDLDAVTLASGTEPFLPPQ
jgi:hypothetical protein